MQMKLCVTNGSSTLRRVFLFFALGLLSAQLSFAAGAATNMVAGAKLKGAETPEKLIKQMADYSRAGDSTNLLNCFDTSTKVHEIGAKSFAISIEIVKAKADL